MQLRKITSLLSLASVFAGAVSAQNYTWYENPANQHLYALTQPDTWPNVELEARNAGGFLATVRSQAEHDFLVQTLGPDRNMWIGATDQGNEGNWRWVSGEPWSFTNWCNNEPNNFGNYEHWGHIAFFPGSCANLWNDSKVTRMDPGIIEILPGTPAYSIYRASCRSSAGTQLQLCNVDLPRIGQTFTVKCEGVLPNTPLGFFFYAIKDDTTAGFPLPFDMTPMGAPGCFINVDVRDVKIAIMAGSNASGRAESSFPIPNQSILIGNQFYNQYFSFDMTANQLGVVASNAGQAYIGN